MTKAAVLTVLLTLGAIPVAAEEGVLIPAITVVRGDAPRSVFSNMDKYIVTVSMVGQGMDGFSTWRALNNGSGCYESNPMLGDNPSTKQLIAYDAIHAGMMVGTMALGGLLERRNPDGKAGKIVKGFSRGLNMVWGVRAARAGVRNVRKCGL